LFVFLFTMSFFNQSVNTIECFLFLILEPFILNKSFSSCELLQNFYKVHHFVAINFVQILFFYKLLLSFYENCRRGHWSLWFGFFHLICSTSSWVFVQGLWRWIKFGFSIFNHLHLKKWNTISYHVEFFSPSSLQCFVSLICYFTRIFVIQWKLGLPLSIPNS
jgi:hypothetical protein